MPKTHAHDVAVEIELTRSTPRLQVALEGLDARKRKQVMRAVEVSINEAVDQTLEWANEHFEEYDHDLGVAASGVLIAMVKAQDEPAVVGRVLGAFLIIGLYPDIGGAVRARRAEHGAKAAAALAGHLARVRATFGSKTSRRATRKAARASGTATPPQRSRARAAKG